jgi:hypothetical protein
MKKRYRKHVPMLNIRDDYHLFKRYPFGFQSGVILLLYLTYRSDNKIITNKKSQARFLGIKNG